ncbi:hypothetical protein [Halorussus halophilus]|nr:hypothetical protein [Halorussus halophilus]
MHKVRFRDPAGSVRVGSLSDGDEVEVEAEGVGVLKHDVRQE